MSELNVGEYFQLPLKPIDYQNGIIDCNGFGVLFADLHGKEKEALCVAINSHDQLVDTITEQEQVISELVSELEATNKLNIELINKHNSKCPPWEQIDMEHCMDNDLLVAKHKQSKGE